MATDVKKFIGTKFDSFHYVVERGKIREFTIAIGDENPIYEDVEIAQNNGLQDITIPPTFATVFDMWGGPDFLTIVEKLELNPLHVLHGEQEYEYLGEVYPNDEITGHMVVIDAKTKFGKSGGMNIVTLETKYSNQRKEMILISRSTIVEQF